MTESSEVSEARKNRIYELQAEVERLREAVESVRDKLQFPPTSTSLIPVPVAEVTEKLHALRNELNAALHPDEGRS